VVLAVIQRCLCWSQVGVSSKRLGGSSGFSADAFLTCPKLCYKEIHVTTKSKGTFLWNFLSHIHENNFLNYPTNKQIQTDRQTDKHRSKQPVAEVNIDAVCYRMRTNIPCAMSSEVG